MRILLQSRRDLLTLFGGDSVQVLRVAEALRARGHVVDLSLDFSPRLDGYDVVHLFNLNRVHETLLQARNAARRGTPIALSPIWHDLDEYESRGRHGLLGLLFRVVRNPSARELITSTLSFARSPRDLYALGHLALTGFRAAQREVLARARVLIPNSDLEAEQLRRDIPNALSWVVAPYAVDRRWTETPADPDGFREHVGFEDFVLSVGRIGARKNQLGLVQALADTDLPVVIVGKEFNGQYAAAIRAAGGPRVRLLGQLPPEALPSAYAACRVHAQPSWFETCGLASLEAGALGRNVVVSDRGYTRWYFGDEAFYVDPSNLASIRKGVLEAWEAPPQTRLAERIAREFTWEVTAEQTEAAYARALGGGEPCST